MADFVSYSSGAVVFVIQTFMSEISRPILLPRSAEYCDFTISYIMNS